MKRFERSRLLILVAVVASLAVALAMFYVTTVDIVSLVSHLVHYHNLALSLWLGLGIALISGAVALSHRTGAH